MKTAFEVREREDDRVKFAASELVPRPRPPLGLFYFRRWLSDTCLGSLGTGYYCLPVCALAALTKTETISDAGLWITPSSYNFGFTVINPINRSSSSFVFPHSHLTSFVSSRTIPTPRQARESLARVPHWLPFVPRLGSSRGGISNHDALPFRLCLTGCLERLVLVSHTLGLL